jgi:hypothetical protein
MSARYLALEDRAGDTAAGLTVAQAVWWTIGGGAFLIIVNIVAYRYARVRQNEREGQERAALARQDRLAEELDRTRRELTELRKRLAAIEEADRDAD